MTQLLKIAFSDSVPNYLSSLRFLSVTAMLVQFLFVVVTDQFQSVLIACAISDSFSP